jgi:hypothetical protein
MAQRGATTHTLMATFGWLDIKQAELYARDIERKRLAREHAHLLGTNQGEASLTMGSQVPAVRENGAKNRG